MNEISPSELYEGLLAYGLFAEQLPPIFSAKSFFDYCQVINPSFPNKPAGYIYYESIRNTNVPRILGIPNPTAYKRLCECIANYWDKIQKHFIDSTINHSYIVSRVFIRKIKNEKKLFEMNYNNWRTYGTPELELLIGARFLVKADISTCFPSIYTHALSWALVGKNIAKMNYRKNNEWYNILDRCTTHINNQETQGLLIGPHTSNLLSEIILTKIDEKLYKDGWRYVRAIDDYTCYVDTYEKGQSFIIELNEQLHYFGLSLNHKKTSIDALPIASEEQWIHRINTFSAFISSNYLNYKNIKAYLNMIIELMEKNDNNSAILKYAIKVIAGKCLSKNARNHYVMTILHLTIIYPYLITQLEDFIFKPFSVDLNTIMNFSQKLLEEGKKTCNYEEASYALYFATKYNFELPNVD
ncbi:MAG: RNA-directed DNA polymerase, partial [Treponema sp.]|nr:RNA-directed DNA polymerase [Treponema sp.]